MVQFLKRLLSTLSGSTHKLPQQDEVEGSEQIARYIFTKKHVSVSKGVVKYGAYMPAPNGEASVFRTSTLSDREIWEIGHEYVAKSSKRPLYARGDAVTDIPYSRIINNLFILKALMIPWS